ncbi:MAG TPA: hypothetical protein VGS28_01575 [Candidatus Saccharimonadales bacterium]|nr:hypothetical protein [Candidatus Saccharimonadales bacterium]
MQRAIRAVSRSVRRIKPIAVVTGLIAIFLIPGTLVWLYNLRTLQYILSIGDLAMTTKLNIIWSAYTSSFYYFHDPIVLTRAIFAVVAGIEMAVIIHVKNSDGTPIHWGRNKIMLFIASLFLVGAVSSLVTSYSAVTLTTDTMAVLLGVMGNIAATLFVIYILASQAKSILWQPRKK